MPTYLTTFTRHIKGSNGVSRVRISAATRVGVNSDARPFDGTQSLQFLTNLEANPHPNGRSSVTLLFSRIPRISIMKKALCRKCWK